jgi:hypothetical protein
MLRSRLLMAVAGAGLASAALIHRAPIGEAHGAGADSTYTVLIKDASSREAAIAAIRRAGGTTGQISPPSHLFDANLPGGGPHQDNALT